MIMAGEEPEVGIQPKPESLPRDIYYNIFSRLQLKSVIRSSCVSKYWYDLIKDPAFVKLHTAQSKPKPSLLILMRRSIGKKHILSISPLKHKGNLLLANESSIAHMVSSASWDLVGTCDGFLCFTSFNEEEEVTMICNPITGEHVILPPPAFAPCTSSRKPEFVFGFDFVVKKHKVLRIDNISSLLRAAVCTLGGDDSWREVRCGDHRLDGKPAYVNGVAYWLVHNLNERILSFDFGSDRFELTPHPRFGGGHICLAELGGRLSVVDLSPGNLVEIWVMKEGVDDRRWEMEYIIPVSKPNPWELRSPRLICVHELDGVLIVWLRDTLRSYEKKAFRIRDVKIKEFPVWLDWEVCSGYRGSLAPLRNIPSTAEDRRVDLVQFVGDTELHSQLLAEGGSIGEREPFSMCEKIVASFHKNGLLI